MIAANSLALERLHLLKKDTSQIGINAREAVKFLDRVTSGQDTAPPDRVSIQEPDQQFPTWADVDKQFPTPEGTEEQTVEQENVENKAEDTSATNGHGPEEAPKENERSASTLSQMLLNKLNFAKPLDPISPKSSPPTTPVSSAPQSSKTSPEVTTSSLVDQEKGRSRTSSFHMSSQRPDVPDSIKPLINSVVWILSNKEDKPLTEPIFLTNNADKGNIVRSFGVKVKNIYQLRAAVGSEDQEAKNQSRYRQKNSNSPPIAQISTEPKTLFKYEENSDDEEVVFKPRSRPNSTIATKQDKIHDSPRDKGTQSRSQAPASSQSPKVTPKKPTNAPVLEIDPDSFDRGPSARSTQQIFNPAGSQDSFRGPPARSHFNGGGNSFSGGRGHNGFHRGGFHNGFGRGGVRGRGKLFNG